MSCVLSQFTLHWTQQTTLLAQSLVGGLGPSWGVSCCGASFVNDGKHSWVCFPDQSVEFRCTARDIHLTFPIFIFRTVHHRGVVATVVTMLCHPSPFSNSRMCCSSWYSSWLCVYSQDPVNLPASNAWFCESFRFRCCWCLAIEHWCKTKQGRTSCITIFHFTFSF